MRRDECVERTMDMWSAHVTSGASVNSHRGHDAAPLHAPRGTHADAQHTHPGNADVLQDTIEAKLKSRMCRCVPSLSLIPQVHSKPQPDPMNRL